MKKIYALIALLISNFSFLIAPAMAEDVNIKIYADEAKYFDLPAIQYGYWTLCVETDDHYIVLSPTTANQYEGTYTGAQMYWNANGGTYLNIAGAPFYSKDMAQDFTLTVSALEAGDEYSFIGSFTSAADGTKYNFEIYTIANPNPTSVTEVAGEKATVSATKTIHNGRLVIEKNGRKFNAAGQVIR